MNWVKRLWKNWCGPCVITASFVLRCIGIPLSLGGFSITILSNLRNVYLCHCLTVIVVGCLLYMLETSHSDDLFTVNCLYSSTVFELLIPLLILVLLQKPNQNQQSLEVEIVTVLVYSGPVVPAFADHIQACSLAWVLRLTTHVTLHLWHCTFAAYWVYYLVSVQCVMFDSWNFDILWRVYRMNYSAVGRVHFRALHDEMNAFLYY